MNINILWIVFKARFLLILFTLALTVSATVVFTKLQPNRYEANTSLVLNFNGASPFEESAMPAQYGSSYVATQLDIISSQSVALKVVDKLNLGNGNLAALTGSGDESDVDISKNAIANELRNQLNVQPSRDSRVVNITFKSKNPKLAAKIANAFADAYIEKNLELSIEPAARSAQWFDDQTQVFRQRREEAQKRLTDYQQEMGIIMIDERLDTETNRLNELSKNYVDAQAKTYDIKSRQLGENHPEYIRAIKREESLHASLEDQKMKFLKIKQQRDKLEVLAREVEAERQAYEEMRKRYYETTLESQFNQSNIAILNRATTPTKASSPNFLLNVVSSVFLGGIIGFVIAFLAEIFDRRVRTEEDIDELLGTRVLAQL